MCGQCKECLWFSIFMQSACILWLLCSYCMTNMMHNVTEKPVWTEVCDQNIILTYPCFYVPGLFLVQKTSWRGHFIWLRKQGRHLKTLTASVMQVTWHKLPKMYLKWVDGTLLSLTLLLLCACTCMRGGGGGKKKQRGLCVCKHNSWHRSIIAYKPYICQEIGVCLPRPWLILLYIM
jgi:hypothetical protein